MFTLKDILQGNAEQFRLQCATTPDIEQVFPTAQHDSRQIGPGDLFVAIKGEQVDGHRYIPDVVGAGAGAVLCSQPSADVPEDFLQIVVPNVVEALQATARVRAERQQGTTFIGITGSNGKTSTKEAIAAILSRQAPTLKTFASYNNEIGYPLTLLRLEPEHRFAVLEMGAQWVGELAWLCETIACPQWAVITNVGVAHLEYFGSVENIASAKGELIEALPPEGYAILNYDDERVRAMNERTRAQVLYYGCAEEAAVRASEISGDTLRGRSFVLSYQGQQTHIQLQIPGDHGVTIALAAAAVGCAAQLSLEEIRAGLEALAPAKGRGEIKLGPRGSTLIDDSYNASRESILAIAQAMHDTPVASTGRRWAVLGDIFELGFYARTEHIETAQELQGLIDVLVAVGDQARYYVDGAIRAGMPADNIYYFDADVDKPAELDAAKQAAADLLKREVQHDDLVLLKGSRGMRMETIIPLL